MNENLNPEVPAEKDTEHVEAVNAGAVNTTEVKSNDVLDSLSKDEIIERVKNLLMQEAVPSRAEVESLKQAFYKLKSASIEQEKQVFIEAGNEEVDFEASIDPLEDVLKTYLAELKKRRAKQLEEEDRLREDNYKKKVAIIDKIKELVESPDDFNKLYKEFKDLQDQWNTIRMIPQGKEKELWTNYQIQSELFYDLIKINNEFRDYDFKKNLEQKTKFCEAAEKLMTEPDSVSAFHQLQNYHKQWREVGPVAKELREDLWTRFKTASTEINKRYQEHFEGLKNQEDENLEKKTAICEKLKTIDYSTLISFKEWNAKTDEVIALQAEWKTIGFVPRKFNTQIFEEFRALCDGFFNQKSEFFKGVKDDMDANLEKKRELCEKAKALKDSTEWKATTEELIAIQKEWKKVGAVPRKYSDAIWKEFVGACDYFFEQKKKNESVERKEETENLEKKTAIIEQLNALDTSLPTDELLKQVRELADQWHKIGFVPFRDKDKAYKSFHKAVDAHYDRLKIDKTERRLENFKSNVEEMSQNSNPKRALMKERDFLMHKYNKMKSDLQTYENNMSFLSISTKGANSLLKDVNVKIEKLKDEMDLLAQQIDTINEKLAEI